MNQHQHQQIHIDKNIPIPNYNRPGKGLSDALRRCDIGDSFEVDITSNRTGLYVLAKHLGVKVTVRLQPDRIHYRVWRTA